MPGLNPTDEKRSSLEFCRLGLQVSLIVCAASLLLSRPYLLSAVRTNKSPAEWLLFGPLLFLVLFIAYLALEYLVKKRSLITASDYLKALFGIMVIVLSFPTSFREVNTRKIHDPLSIDLIEKFSKHADARIRALAILASSRYKIDDPALGALIHKSLLDKDPLVQQAAKLVIEDNFGIRLKKGAEGIHQAQSLIDVSAEASLMQKGLP